jgi:hypothetical protein
MDYYTRPDPPVNGIVRECDEPKNYKSIATTGNFTALAFKSSSAILAIRSDISGFAMPTVMRIGRYRFFFFSNEGGME